jgi:hypothetical protein
MRHNSDMATWQFDVHLIPRAELLNIFGFLPAKIDKESFNARNWWHNTKLPNGYREILSSFVPVGSSWCEDIELWGDEEGDRIDVSHDEGRIDAVYVRISAISLNKSFVSCVAQFAQTCDCLILTEDDQLIEPSPDLLGKAVLQSNAARFVANPRKFLDDLGATEFES